MRHLFVAVLLIAIATSFVVLNIQRRQLNEHAQSVAAFAAQTDSTGWKFKVLRGLSVESDHQRDAMQTLLTHWDELLFRNNGIWPEIDGRKLNTMLFTDAYPGGATVTVLVLMDWDENKAVDAVSFVSDPKTEQHSIRENIDENGQYGLELLAYPPNAYQLGRKRLKWTLGANGFLEQPTTDRMHQDDLTKTTLHDHRD